ncbi:MAG: histidine phosphotransferase [Alphaproteobacteria bacterium]|nr:histidine phosphotransferase [Alphaproteobacteria bacterium]
MFYDRQDMIALISSRICHDLISPLGAISNGLELLDMAGLAEGPEMALIGDSIASANSKIRFFRVAYGRAPTGSTLAQGEILSILRDYFASRRIDLVWHPLREAQRRDIKLVFLAIQCLETALPYGGEISVSIDGSSWVIATNAEKLRLQADHWALLEGQDFDGELVAARVQFGMLAMLSQWRKPALVLEMSDKAISIRL